MAKRAKKPAGTAENVRPQGVGGSPAPAPSSASGLLSKRGRRLRTVANVRAALASTYRLVEKDAMGLQKARVLREIATALLMAIQGADLEARVAALEGRRSE